MAGKISDLTSHASIDRANDLLEIVDVSDSESKKITVNTLLGISGDPVGDSDTQTLSAKTLDNTNAITVTDANLTLQDNSDTTKQVRFQLSGITTATTRTLTLPDVTDTLVTLAATQTLTNKTLTSPTLNTPIITNPTLATDAISEHTVANGVSIDGLSIKDGKLNTNDSVVTANVTDGAITAAKIANDTITGANINWTGTGADAGIWWEELGRASLSATNDTLTVSSLPARKYLRVMFHMVPNGTVGTEIRFNSDSGSNYSWYFLTLYASGYGSTSQTSIPTEPSTTTVQTFGCYDVVNIAAREKLLHGSTVSQSTAGAGTAPTIGTVIGKWVNTADAISSVSLIQSSTGDFASGTELIILGHN